MREVVVLLVSASMLLLAIPTTSVAQTDGAEGSGDVTFYGHVFGHGLGAPMPANTEFPAGEENYGIGSGAECLPQVPDLIAPSCEDAPWNKLALFSTAGFVDVTGPAEFDQAGSYAQLHNERGQSKDVLLDTSGQVSTTLYGTWDAHGWAVRAGNPYPTDCVGPHPPGLPCVYPYWGWDPGVFEDVVVEATLYHADLGSRTNTSQAPPVQEAVENGDATVVAEGQWGPGQVMNGLPDSPNAFRWDIDLGSPQVDTIPRSDDFFLVYSTYQQTADTKRCIDCPMRWWGGEFFPPTFELPVENAFTVERTIPTFANAQLAILGILNSPWGSYDVDEESLDLRIEGPSGTVSPQNIEQYSDFSTAHGGHYDPVNVTWIWDYRADELDPGDYEVTVSASNYQASASSSCTATFTIGEEQGGLVPGQTDPGECGTQSATVEETAERSQEGVEEQTEEDE